MTTANNDKNNNNKGASPPPSLFLHHIAGPAMHAIHYTNDVQLGWKYYTKGEGKEVCDLCIIFMEIR